MKTFPKKNLPVRNIRRFLEPGPIVLLSSAYKQDRTIMTMGWHMVMEFEPSMIGCYIWDENFSQSLVKKSKECVINIPTYDLIETIIDIGNSHGSEFDKFKEFGLTAVRGKKVNAPMIGECFANFECKLIDTSFIKKYSLFVFEVVKAHVANSPRYPKTVHYRGEGIFMISGKNVDYHRRFKSVNL